MASRIAEKLAAKKAAIYIRVSTHWQVDKDSLKVQRRELIAYVTLVLGITDYVVFEDPGYSAKNTDRPEYQAMMDRIRTGEFTHLVVWKIDRISRNLIDFAAMHDELGVDVLGRRFGEKEARNALDILWRENAQPSVVETLRDPAERK